MVHQESDQLLFSSSFSGTSCGISTSSPGLLRMRVFLVQTAKGLHSSSGGYRANICLLRYLASRGHHVKQLCYAHNGETEMYIQNMINSRERDPQVQKRLLHLRAKDGGPGIDVEVNQFVMDDGVQVVALNSKAFEAAFGGEKNTCKEMARETAEYIETGTLSARLLDFVSFLQREVTNFSPTHFISNDGLSIKATSALEMPRMNLSRIGIIHTAEQLPFGPYAGGMPGHATSPSELKLLQALDGIWSVSNAIKQYALEYGQLQTSFFVHHPWTYLEEKKRQLPVPLHNWDKQFIGMINPCVVKGLPILINIAKSCPQYDFLVYASWGFDETVATQLAGLENITLGITFRVRSTCSDMEVAWRHMKVLLVPSLWFEAWGIVVIEAHLRGIPVVSSNAGALPEAMLGLDHIIPVDPIAGERDEEGAYCVPEQNIGLWVKTIDKLMKDRSEYLKLSFRARNTTEHWLKNIDEMALHDWLLGLGGQCGL